MKRHRWCAAALLVFCCPSPASAEEEAALLRRAQALKPTARDRKWEQIPWLLDLKEGLRAAHAERRPLLLWVAGDDPLERC